jgi:integrase
VARKPFTGAVPTSPSAPSTRTGATLLLLANEPTKVVSKRLGHASAQVTETIYQHVLPTMKARAAEKVNRLLAQALQPKPLTTASPAPTS